MIYCYICKNCNHKFCINRLYNDYIKEPTRKCPSCKSSNTKRVYESPPAIIFKDSDFTKHIQGE